LDWRSKRLLDVTNAEADRSGSGAHLPTGRTIDMEKARTYAVVASLSIAYCIAFVTLFVLTRHHLSIAFFAIVLALLLLHRFHHRPILTILSLVLAIASAFLPVDARFLPYPYAHGIHILRIEYGYVSPRDTAFEESVKHLKYYPGTCVVPLAEAKYVVVWGYNSQIPAD
jgi:hypothetical protein